MTYFVNVNYSEGCVSAGKLECGFPRTRTLFTPGSSMMCYVSTHGFGGFVQHLRQSFVP